MLAKNRWRKRLFRALLLFGTLVSLTAAESKKLQPGKPEQIAPSSNRNTAHNLHVSINSSTAKIIEGAVYGLNADLENVSNVPISIDVRKVNLTVQPELAPPNVACVWSYPAESDLASPILLQPGDHITIFFSTSEAVDSAELTKNPGCKVGYWGSLRKRLDFVPGNFAFVVTGTYKIPPPPNKSATQKSAVAGTAVAANLEEHYFTETASLPVTIDQAQMIIFAGLGGLLAFLVMSFRNAETLWEYAGKVRAAPSSSLQKLVVILRGAGAAILLSAAVTVVAGRLSETAFPVKVSVEDFWGALTVGFVSYFIGGKFIDKLSQTLTPKSQQPASTPAAPAAPVTPP
jgi:hypothetical protein